MRIGVVTTSYPRHPGDAAGQFVSELSDCIQDAGHEVEVVAAGDRSRDELWQRARVHRVCAGGGLFYRGGAPEALAGRGYRHAAAFSLELARTVRRLSAGWDGVVAHWLLPSAAVAATVRRQLPLWAIAHGGDVHLVHKLALGRPLMGLLDRDATHINFVSRAARESFSDSRDRSVWQRSGVWPMGIDLPRLRALPRADEGERPVLLFVGRLVPIKGADLLLRAVAQLGETYDLIIAGEGPERGKLEALAGKLGVPASFVGEVDAAGRDALLARAQVVVVPSRVERGRAEGMPRVALEALAVGARLVVSDSGGLAEIPGSLCSRFPAGNPDALRRELQAIPSRDPAPRHPGSWLEERSWGRLAPRILPGLIPAQ